MINIPESKAAAKKRAKKKGFPKKNVVCVKDEKGKESCYIAPHGVGSSAGKKAYAEARESGRSKESAARIAHHVDKKKRKKKK